jgi:hypothetical protein
VSDPFEIFKARVPKKTVDVATRLRVKDIESRKGRLVEMGPKKTLPRNVSGKEFVQWVRTNRLGIK